MNYPTGLTIRKNDLVWWDNFNRVGRVALVLTDPASMESWGLSAPGIFICCNVIESEPTPDIFYSETHLAEDEIQPLSETEIVSLRRCLERELHLHPGVTKLIASPMLSDDGEIQWRLQEQLEEGGIAPR